MNEKVHELLNQQINKEFYSAYLYLDFSNYFKAQGLDGFANLSVFLPLRKPNASKTENGASTDRQLTFIFPVCLMT